MASEPLAPTRLIGESFNCLECDQDWEIGLRNRYEVMALCIFAGSEVMDVISSWLGPQMW